jgi:hypothetical protein
MKKNVTAWCAVFLLSGICVVHSADPALLNQDYVSYFAGMELLTSNKTLSRMQIALRYRRLCTVTGINGARAKAFVAGYRNDPAGWQKVRAAVLEALQKHG